MIRWQHFFNDKTIRGYIKEDYSYDIHLQGNRYSLCYTFIENDMRYLTPLEFRASSDDAIDHLKEVARKYYVGLRKQKINDILDN
jgi:hypothetical protein